MGPATQRLQHLRRVGHVARLADAATGADDDRVDAEDGSRPLRRPTAPCPRRARAGLRSGDSTNGGATTSNGIASCSRIARRCGEVDARTSGVMRVFGRPRSPRPAIAWPTRPSRTRSTSCVSASAGAWSSSSRSMSKPFARSRSIHSPCGELELDAALGPLEPAHPELRAARAPGRPARRRSSRGRRGSSCAGRRAGRQVGAGALPRGSSGTGRPRSRRRTRRRRGRRTRRVARSRPRRLRRAGTRCRSRPSSVAPCRAARA